ncbi:cation-transporting ATPase [Deinococcus aerius]|uniref:Cation-transporting ATPase n=2 Tax=Deinococcus TaxID=1298 RepID=A0A2I9CS77_9DEIO|nr:MULTISPECIES: cation-transporting P-type ATPase [Deinococcus]MBB5293661.1 Ca2+-transporting ATPase [Deinococcus metallilatus]QBY07363.1 cation-transporting P-type ATPase [Deinococcus metallilatus]RXJ14836.1 cation-transporting P-type ATPase [Deinococcus metallilatus]TLK30957.1 cation-transporting P-type ATPase [Deinococcus metallilatus]GBF04459.1 cation-transporting ATPase [Deinococcus aerius]
MTAEPKAALPHAQDPGLTLRDLAASPERGLSEAAARERLAQFGPNVRVRPRQVTFLRVALEEITEPMILLLLAVGMVYALWGDPRDALAILGIIAAILAIELTIEFRAKKAVAALGTLVPTRTTVLRGGQETSIDTADLVPGDVVLLRSGERVPADLRLLEGSSLALDESALTGESVPVEKDAHAVLPADAPLAERSNMLYAGTVITRGSGRAVVVATGTQTEIGRITGLVDAAREPKTPLQKAMKALSGTLVKVALAFSIGIPLLGVLLGQPVKPMLLTGMTLAFATIPEEMPIIITLVLGFGALTLARQRALVKRLQAAEALGAVTVLATDKTGTLTQNVMTVRQLAPASRVSEWELRLAAGLATERGSDDPTDQAVLREVEAQPGTWTPLRAFPFTAETRAVTVVQRQGEVAVAYTKGALESLLNWAAPGTDRAHWQQTAGDMGAQGLRVLAVGRKPVDTQPLDHTGATRGLTLLGLIGLSDPPRPEAGTAVQEAREAGIRVIMITGDHPVTAAAIAREVGLPESRVVTGAELDTLTPQGWEDAARIATVFARVTPEHKLRLVERLQGQGEIVAMTGDGVNDAPALKQANVGVAMGGRGSDVAREAAAVVLTDNNFATLVSAVREGRRLYDNLRKGTRYYLAIKVALILAALVTVLLGLPVIFAPIQIIVLELFMDVNAALGFATEKAEPDVMKRPPRDPQEPFLDAPLVRGLLLGGLCLFAVVLANYLRVTFLVPGATAALAQTEAFLTWLLGHATLAFVMRGERGRVPLKNFFANRVITLWTLAVVVTCALAVSVPGVQRVLKTVPIPSSDWAWVIGLALLGALAFSLLGILIRPGRTAHARALGTP